MKIKLPEKCFFTVQQLADRWEVLPADVDHLFETAQLTKRDKMAVLEGGADAEYTFFNINRSPFGTDVDLMPGEGLGYCIDGLHFGREVRVEIYLDVETDSLPTNAKFERIEAFIDRHFPESKIAVVSIEDVLEFEKQYAKSQAGQGDGIERGALAFRDESLLSVIAALLAQWPNGKPPSGKDLEKAAQSIGLKVSDDTIRKALKAAQEIAPSLTA
jgi:hypothetical protein